FLHYLRETLLYQAVQHFVNLLPGNVRPRRQLERLEFRVTEEHQVGPGLVGIQAQLLETPPEPLKFHLDQCVAHGFLTISARTRISKGLQLQMPGRDANRCAPRTPVYLSV